MRRRAPRVPEDRVLAMLTLARVTDIAAVQVARKAEPPVPAAGRLQQIAAERAHRAKLRRRRQHARLPQGLRDLRIDLELCERRAGSYACSIHAARDDRPHLD